MWKIIKGKELKELLDNQEICLRCGVTKKELRNKGYQTCGGWGFVYKRHIYK